MSTTHLSQNPPSSPQLGDDEIDLRQIAAALGRQKFLIVGISVAAALISGLYAFTRKPVWEGSFQIVLEAQNSGSVGRLAQLSAANPILANLAGLGGGAGQSSLETEVKILESPSVLKPVYDFVKTNKASTGEDISAWKFTNWVNSLSIELVQGTSVLNLTYQDTDKSLVLPVLQKITMTYQEYSNRDNANSIDSALKFADEQSKILRKKQEIPIEILTLSNSHTVSMILQIRSIYPSSTSFYLHCHRPLKEVNLLRNWRQSTRS